MPELTMKDRVEHRTVSLSPDSRSTHDDQDFQGPLAPGPAAAEPCHWLEPHEQFKINAESFVRDALKLIGTKIADTEAELARWRRKRQEMIGHAERLGLSTSATDTHIY